MKDQSNLKSKFNKKYTFDNFVVGKSNQVVCAAMQSVAQNPGQKFNPLFIYLFWSRAWENTPSPRCWKLFKRTSP